MLHTCMMDHVRYVCGGLYVLGTYVVDHDRSSWAQSLWFCSEARLPGDSGIQLPALVIAEASV